jgi:hypothetical protein
LDVNQDGAVNVKDAEFLNLVVVQTQYLFWLTATTPGDNGTSSSGSANNTNCLLSLDMQLITRAGGSAFTPSHSKVFAQLEVATAAAVAGLPGHTAGDLLYGSLVSTSLGSSGQLHGAVYELSYVASSNSFVMAGAVNGSAAGALVGVSMVEMLEDDVGDLTVELLSGDDTKVRVYPEQLNISLPTFGNGTKTSLASISAGFSPLLNLTLSNTTEACALRNSSSHGNSSYVCNTTTEYFKPPLFDCAPLTACNLSQYLVANATLSSDRLCAAATACNYSTSYMVNASNGVSNTVCRQLTVCSAGEQQVVSPTATSDRVCGPSQNYNQTVLLTVSSSSSGAYTPSFLNRTLVQSTTNALTFTDSILEGDGSSTTVTAALGSIVSASKSITRAAGGPGVSFQAVLATQQLYYDAPTATVFFQVSDSSFSSTNVQSTTMQLQLVPSSKLAALSGGSGTVNGSCSTSSGRCSASASAKSAWYSQVSRDSLNNVVSVFGGIQGDSLAFLGNLTLLTLQNTSSESGNILAVLPAYPLYPGGSTTVQVSSVISGSQVGGFSIVVSVSSTDLSISAALNSPNAWSGSTSTTATAVSLFYTLNSASDATDSLFTVTLTASTSAAVNVNHTVTVTVEDLTDVYGNTLLPSGVSSLPCAGLVRDRRGLQTSGSGLIFVAAVETVGLLASAAQSQLVNLASLTGSNITVPVTTTAITNTASSSTLSAGSVTLSSANTTVLATGAGGNLLLTSSQTAAASQLAVLVSAGGLNTSLNVSVRVLQSLSVVSDSYTLHGIEGWLNASDSSCQTLVYEQAELQAFAVFGGAGLTAFSADVTALVQDAFVSSNSTVLSISNSSGRVLAQGAAAGNASILVRRGGTLLAQSALLTVVSPTNATVAVVGLDVVPVSSLSLSVSGGGDLAVFQQGTLTTMVVANSLTAEGSSIYLYSTLVLSNNRRIEVGTGSGVTYSTLAASEMSVSGYTATVAVGASSGTGAYVGGQWKPSSGSCHSSASASGNATLSLALPAASSVTLSTPPARLLYAGRDAALCQRQQPRHDAGQSHALQHLAVGRRLQSDCGWRQRHHRGPQGRHWHAEGAVFHALVGQH